MPSMTAGYWFAPPAAYDALLHTASRYDPLRHRSAHFVALVDTVTGTVLLLNSMPRRSSPTPLGVVGSNAFVSASAQSRHRRLAPARPRPANTSTSSRAALLMDELGPDDQANSTDGHQTAGAAPGPVSPSWSPSPRPGREVLTSTPDRLAGARFRRASMDRRRPGTPDTTPAHGSASPAKPSTSAQPPTEPSGTSTQTAASAAASETSRADLRQRAREAPAEGARAAHCSHGRVPRHAGGHGFPGRWPGEISGMAATGRSADCTRPFKPAAAGHVLVLSEARSPRGGTARLSCAPSYMRTTIMPFCLFVSIDSSATPRPATASPPTARTMVFCRRRSRSSASRVSAGSRVGAAEGCGG